MKSGCMACRGAWHVGAWLMGEWHVLPWYVGAWHVGAWHVGAWLMGAWHVFESHVGAWCGSKVETELFHKVTKSMAKIRWISPNLFRPVSPS